MKFKQLHNTNEPLLICNVWDVASAKLAEKLKFKAIGTSSAALAHSLGFEDGEKISFNQLYQSVQQIQAHTHLPLSVDIEAGYSDDPTVIVENIKKLAKLGVQGVNIEDSKVTSQRQLVDEKHFAQLLKVVKQRLNNEGIELFINVRTDVFLMGVADPVAQAQSRIKQYQLVGADGIFVPGVVDLEDIQALVGICKLPLNVMCMPGLADFKQLSTVGVKRISIGNFLYDNIQQHLQHQLTAIIEKQNFTQVFESASDRAS